MRRLRAAAGLLLAAFTLILALAPEGTRKPTREWKTGFWHVAKGANLPIVLGFFDYGRKTVGFGPILWPGELEEDMKTIQQFYASKTPKRPENFRPGPQP